MASELTQKIMDAIVVDDSYVGDIDERTTAAAIDAELAEVREVLDGLIRHSKGEAHEESCIALSKRASALYEKFRIDK
jgi:predicted ATP-grasp superfamily ATP-dependent carboligase